MKLSELREAVLQPNVYFKVEKNFTVWELTGHEPSNSYYGSARIHKPVYKKMELERDDEIHWLHGGVFAVKVFNTDKDGAPGHASTSHMISLREPKEFSPFEKSYGSNHMDSRSGWLNELVSEGKLSSISKSEATKVKYTSH